MKNKKVKQMVESLMKSIYGMHSIEFTKYNFTGKWVPVLECWYAPCGAPDSEWDEIYWVYGTAISIDGNGKLTAVGKNHKVGLYE